MTELSEGLLPPIITQTRGIRIQDKETIERELEFSSMTPISHLHLLAWIQSNTTATFGIGKKFHLSAMTLKVISGFKEGYILGSLHSPIKDSLTPIMHRTSIISTYTIRGRK